MRKINLFGSTAAGFIMGAVLLGTMQARADIPTIDIAAIIKETGILDVLTVMQGVQNTINTTLGDINKAVGGTIYGDTNTLLREGFTQDANYSKAQIGAQQQIADASNTAMARFNRDIRNAQIRDEQTASPAHCAAIDGGVSTQSAAVQAFGVGQAIAAVHDLRGEAVAGMPSHFGQAQAVASMSQEHLRLYCNADDAATGLCNVSANPDGDQKASSFLGSGAYPDQDAVNTAKDFAINIIEPIAPAALRGDQLAGINGQDAAVRRRSYNARMSLAQSFVDNAIGMQVPSIPLTELQKKYLTNMGLPVPDSGNGSWLQVLQVEAERRVADISWHGTLQNMPPSSVIREIALELALLNYMTFQQIKIGLGHGTISATHLAEDTDRNFMPTARMPTPSMASAAQ